MSDIDHLVKNVVTWWTYNHWSRSHAVVGDDLHSTALCGQPPRSSGWVHIVPPEWNTHPWYVAAENKTRCWNCQKELKTFLDQLERLPAITVESFLALYSKFKQEKDILQLIAIAEKQCCNDESNQKMLAYQREELAKHDLSVLSICRHDISNEEIRSKWFMHEFSWAQIPDPLPLPKDLSPKLIEIILKIIPWIHSDIKNLGRNRKNMIKHGVPAIKFCKREFAEEEIRLRLKLDKFAWSLIPEDDLLNESLDRKTVMLIASLIKLSKSRHAKPDQVIHGAKVRWANWDSQSAGFVYHESDNCTVKFYGHKRFVICPDGQIFTKIIGSRLHIHEATK